MENWKELAVCISVVILVSLIFGFSEIPYGWGKMFAYIGVSILPVYVIQDKKISEFDKSIKKGEFIFALFLNVCLVLTFAMTILNFFNKV
jgi:hypothetical protein